MIRPFRNRKIVGKVKGVILILIFFFFHNISNSQIFRNAFDNGDIIGSNNGQGYSFYCNVQNELNSASGILESYVTMYYATHDKHYLNSFIIQAKRIQQMRDDELSRSPTGPGQIVNIPEYISMYNCTIQGLSQIPPDSKGWSCVESNTCTFNVQRVLHSGKICYGMARFIYLIKVESAGNIDLQNTALPSEASGTYMDATNLATFFDFANWLEARVNQTIHWHDCNWQCEMYHHDCGTQCDNATRDQINMQCAMGKTLIFMYEVSLFEGKENLDYLHKVITIAALLRGQLTFSGLGQPNSIAPNLPQASLGYWYWCHDWDCGNGEWEDLEHGREEALFADWCYQFQIGQVSGNALSFSLTDMQKFGNTVAYQIYAGPLQNHRNVYGSDYTCDCPNCITGGDGKDCKSGPHNEHDALVNYNAAIGNWAFLMPYNPYIHQIESDYFCDKALHYYIGSLPTSDLTYYQNRSPGLYPFNPVAVLRSTTKPIWGGVCSGNFDGNGNTEFVAASNLDGSLSEFTRDANNIINAPSFTPSSQILNGIPTGWSCLAAGDVLGAGHDEIAGLNKNKLYIIEQNGNTLSIPTLPNNPCTAFSADDLTSVSIGDADPDFPGKEIYVSDKSTGTLLEFVIDPNAGNSISLRHSFFVINALEGVAVGDFDISSPGNEISTVNNSTGAVQIYKLQGGSLTLLYSIANVTGSSPWAGNAISSGDFDGDGIDELVARDGSNGFIHIYKVKNNILTEVGVEAFPLDQNIATMCSARFNNDLTKDNIIILRNADGQISIFDMNGICPSLNLSNTTISDATTIDNPYTNVNNDYPIDYHANSRLVAGNSFDIQAPSTVTFTAGKEICFANGFSSENGSKMSAYIDPSAECSNDAVFRHVSNHAPSHKQQNVAAMSISASVQPNPNNGNMQLQYNIPTNAPGQFSIYDLTGREISKYPLSASQNTLSISQMELQNGIYYYRVSSNGNIVRAGKFVISK